MASAIPPSVLSVASSTALAGAFFSGHSHRELQKTVVAACLEAAQVLIELHSPSLAVEKKADGSPVTQADLDSHSILVQNLSTTPWPIVSEEAPQLSMETDTYWCIDPLDGTKDYLTGQPDFTVNVALIHGQVPILGVVGAPAYNALYIGIVGQGAEKWTTRDSAITRRQALLPKDKAPSCRMAISRFHPSPDVTDFMADNGIAALREIGSSLKYCGLAEGLAEVSPRLVGSSEWDTAAAQAILEATGGQLLDWHTGLPLRYGKPNWRNPRFIAVRAPYVFSDFSLRHFEHELL